MHIKDLIPWGRNDRALDRPGDKERDAHPVAALQDEMNRVFESFWNRFDRTFSEPWSGSSIGALRRPFREFGLPWRGAGPRSDVVETADGVEVTVELPGIDQKDVEVTVTDDMLTVKGEKKAQREDSGKGYYLSERSYGSFQRSIALPFGVVADKAEATFKNGVLTVKLPQSPEAKAKAKRIEVKAA